MRNKPASSATRPTAPLANRAVVEGELRRALRVAARRRERHGPAADTARVLLLRAAAEWHGEPQLRVGEAVVAVRACPTVLAVLEVVSAPRENDNYVVVLTPCEADELGDSVLAQSIGQEVRPVNRWDLVREAFGASKLDPRLTATQHQWLAEALLEAQPAGGWRLRGPVLGLDTALTRLAVARLGTADTRTGVPGAEDEALDAAALLEWTRDEAGVARFVGLRAEERAGLAAWLSQSVGPVARVVFGMLGHTEITDAIPFGLAAAELYCGSGNTASGKGATGAASDSAALARVRAEERFFGGHAPDTGDLGRFAVAAESLVARWNDVGHADWADPMCDRAEQILAGLGAADLAGASNVLDAGFDARLAVLADELERILPAPLPVDLGPSERALNRLCEHRRAGPHAEEVQAAAAAVRLARWLAVANDPPTTLGTLAEAATLALRSWAWIDRALAVVSNADPARVPRLAAVYATLSQAIRECRTELDRLFAQRLASWTEASGVTRDLLLAENILARIARPVAERQAPLLIVLDAMSTAVACELAEEIAADWPWLEAGRTSDGREPGIAVVPSITSTSRTSLLSGALRTGGQAEEKAGFVAFWRGRRAHLFHKADLRGEVGTRINPVVREAIRDIPAVVGVVLNTIDDALDRGREGGAPCWHLDGIAYLRALLDEAWRAGRPVILTADHGHVLDSGAPIRAEHADSARFRTGAAGDGEVTIRGPRVFAGGGEIVAAWDERIHYTPRKAGYHGGASAAEMVLPLLVFVPSVSLVPKGWAILDAPGHAPPWWDSPLANPGDAGLAARARESGRPTRKRAAGSPKPTSQPPVQEDALFEVGEVGSTAIVEAAESLGAQVAASQMLEMQRQFARRAPADEQVAALIDGIAAAGGKVPVAIAAELAGEPVFRMNGYVAQVARLLNVNGYRVIGEADGGRTIELNIELLRQQFLGGG